MNDGRWDHQPHCSIWYDAQSFPIALISDADTGGAWHLKWINSDKSGVPVGSNRDDALAKATQLIRESVHGKP